MTQTQLLAVLAGTGLPVAYRQWKTPPALPYLVYLYANSSDLIADCANYQAVSNWQVELYSVNKDPTSEEAVEAALKAAKIPYAKSENYLDSEDLYEVLYLITTI